MNFIGVVFPYFAKKAIASSPVINLLKWVFTFLSSYFAFWILFFFSLFLSLKSFFIKRFIEEFFVSSSFSFSEESAFIGFFFIFFFRLARIRKFLFSISLLFCSKGDKYFFNSFSALNL